MFPGSGPTSDGGVRPAASGSTRTVSREWARLNGRPASTKFSHSMIQFSGRVSNPPIPPDNAVKVNSNPSVAGVPLLLKLRLKS